MGSACLQHFVVTRLGIGIHNEDWYRSTLGLFEAITFPSLCAQSCADFASLLIVDHDMPGSARARLSEIVGDRQNFHVVPLNLIEMNSVRQGCFDYVWDRCQDYLLANRLVTDPFDYIITSVLDGDDAWHRETVAIVHERVAAEIPELLASEQRKMTWVRHSGGMCLTFADGLKWFVEPDVVVPMHFPFNSMSIFVAARFSSGVSACSSRHTQWRRYHRVLDFKSIVHESDKAMWAYVRHDRTEVPWEVGDMTSDLASAALLRSDFGIDFEKVERWRANRDLRALPLSDADPHRHPGMAGTEQLDCYFRITALNRQISILEREASHADPQAPVHPLLAQQRAARDRLIRIFLEQAQSNFR